MSDDKWLLLLRTAQDLQHADSSVLYEAIAEYTNVVLQQRSLDTPEVMWAKPGYTENASKILLVLRLMFDLPSEPYTDSALGRVPVPGGFQAFYEDVSSNEMEFRGSLVSWPIQWTERGPQLVGGLGGDNGPPYEATKDYLLLRHFRFRELTPTIRQFELRTKQRE